ncbi:MAG: endonuclease/exonuclease/phosphatase family protein [Actinomycetota bacterium]|nr:endonuclease/exonuclease/phosphatase family protein [Actinomycetota bacterium]
MTAPGGGRAGGSRAGAVVGVLSYAAAAALTLVVAVRLVGPSDQPRLVALQALTPYLLVAAYPLTVVGAVRSQRVLTAVGVVLMVAHVAWTVPEIARGRPDAVPDGAVTVRLVTSNVYEANPTPERLAAHLLDVDADLVLLQELTPELLDTFEAAGLTDGYPHRVLDPLPGAQGSGILSRLPLDDGRAFAVAGWPMTTALVTVGDAEVRVVNVHAAAPLSDENAARWERQLDELAGARDLGGDHVVLAGDFNATLQHAPLRGLLDADFREAYREAGRGLGATWPVGLVPLVGPLIRIDHVFVTPGLGVADIGLGSGHGSDHRPVVVDLVVE